MTTLMSASQRAHLDSDWPTEGRVLGVARQLRDSNAWQLITEAYRPGATVTQRTDLLLDVAGRFADMLDADDLAVLAAVALPHLTVAQRASTVADVATWLDTARAFADCGNRYDVDELIDGTVTGDWHQVAELEADTARRTAWGIAREAVAS